MELRLRRALLVPAVAALALSASACGGDDAEAARADRSSDATAAPSDGPRAAGPADGSGDANGSAVGGDSGAVSAAEMQGRPAPGDLANFSCTQGAKGVWSAEGDVHNSAGEPMVYTVTVVTLAGGAVTGDASDEVLLEPDESVRVDLARISRGSSDGCVPRVVRAPR